MCVYKFAYIKTHKTYFIKLSSWFPCKVTSRKIPSYTLHHYIYIYIYIYEKPKKFKKCVKDKMNESLTYQFDQC